MVNATSCAKFIGPPSNGQRMSGERRQPLELQQPAAAYPLVFMRLMVSLKARAIIVKPTSVQMTARKAGSAAEELPEG